MDQEICYYMIELFSGQCFCLKQEQISSFGIEFISKGKIRLFFPTLEVNHNCQ